jgi:hypothetical protein
LSNENFLKSVFVVAIEIVLFIGNVEELCFFKIAETVDLDLYEFWKILNPIHLHFAIPSPLRVHFSEIEIQLFTFMIWKKVSLSFRNDLSLFIKDHSHIENNKEVDDLKNIEFNNQSLWLYLNKSDFVDTEVDIESQYPNLRFYAFIHPVYVIVNNFRFFLEELSAMLFS